MRKIFSELSVDEDRLIDNGDETVGDRLEQEFGWLEQSGVFLKNWLIADEGDEEWTLYINYLFKWAFDHCGLDNEGNSPFTYPQWWAFRMIQVILDAEALDQNTLFGHIERVVRHQKSSGIRFADLYERCCTDKAWGMNLISDPKFAVEKGEEG